ncbi:MAG: hypothetical protein K6U10_02055 [Acidobacteriia bacterium]|nr:hypothetical protein [Methyloceanibacter sp.]MBX5470855.1 hypothetical protein [Acetobacteraceae bacterium]MCL6490584.1 hypothetical protein [Terriglobia bacterium]
MMVQLVLVFCALAQPQLCREQRPVFDPPLTLMGCITGGQRSAAQWLAEHPNWELRRWRCETGPVSGGNA